MPHFSSGLHFKAIRNKSPIGFNSPVSTMVYKAHLFQKFFLVLVLAKGNRGYIIIDEISSYLRTDFDAFCLFFYIICESSPKSLFAYAFSRFLA